MALSPTSSRSSGSASAVTLLGSQTLGSNGLLDIASLDQTYNDLLIVAIIRTASASLVNGAALVINNDTAANYDHELMQAFATTVSGAETFAAAEVSLGNIPGTTAAGGLFATVEILIAGYASTTWQKTVLVSAGYRAGAATTNIDRALVTGHWRSTAAVNRVRVSGAGGGNLVTGSTFRIYGRL